MVQRIEKSFQEVAGPLSVLDHLWLDRLVSIGSGETLPPVAWDDSEPVREPATASDEARLEPSVAGGEPSR